MSLVGRPPVIFLDEPTTGLDPQSRLEVWQLVRELADAGTTVLLTTQDLDEAEHLADRIAILHRGRIIHSGSPAALKRLLPAAEIEYVEKQPTLEEVFLALVGSPTSNVGSPTSNVGSPHQQRRIHRPRRMTDVHSCHPRHPGPHRAVAAAHPAQPGHDHHDRSHPGGAADAVRVGVRGRDPHRQRRLHRLSAPPASC